MKFTKQTPRSKNRARKVTYFNPPFNAAVTTDIGKQFLTLILKHFPKHNKYSKIFNRNTVKLSYSCTPNIKSIITSHNKTLLTPQDNQASRPCNCRKYACPLNGECRNSAVIYKATVNTEDRNKTKEYIGVTETEFKTRYYSHESSFRNHQHRNKTSLSQHIWKLKEQGEPFEVKWSLIAKSRPYSCGTRRCDLCTTEKYEIITNQSNQALNKRNEIANTCRHRAKFKLKNVK